MGIKGLWGLLTPFGEKRSLHEIRGETIAVDLSGWVCDSQNVADHHVQPKLYLRNLFFRTVYLLLAEVNPIFVLEGDAPEMKRDIMAARNAVQFKGTASRSDKGPKKKPNVARKQFRFVLRECESLLKCMGVCCTKGQGEAEATCAALNAQGVVDAVVSQDSDSFAYGARRVYRNFSASSSGGGGALQGSIDCYDAQKILQQNGFGRKKMVALALLCGCDYGAGACGLSTGTVIAFLHTIDEDDVIPRLVSWVNDPEKFDELQRWVTASGRCDRCGHSGRNHGKSGCSNCGTCKGCNDTGHKAKVTEVKRELSLRSRALSSGLQFPDSTIMEEFLHQKPEQISKESLKPGAPSLIEFVKLMRNKLDWSERYSVEKFLPVLSRWHFQPNVSSRSIRPQTIKKKRNPRGVPSYEVVWCDIDGRYDGLIPDDQFESDEDLTSVWTTTERQDLMKTYYPEVVEAYEESIKKPQKEKKSRKKREPKDTENQKPKSKSSKKKLVESEIDKLRKSMGEMNISCKEDKANVSVKINKLKRKNNKRKNQKTIHSFLTKRKKSMENKTKSFNNIFLDSIDKLFDDCIENKNYDLILKTQQKTEEISMLNLSQNDFSENDLSNIIDNLVKNDCLNNKNHDLILKPKQITKKNSMFNLSQNDVLENDLSNIVDNLVKNDSLINKNFDLISKSKEKTKEISTLNLSQDDVSENDLSNIVDKLVNNAPVYKTASVNNKLVRLVFAKKGTPKKFGFRKSFLSEVQNKCSTPINSPNKKTVKTINNSLNLTDNFKMSTSFFFDKLTDERDAFELSLDYKKYSDCDDNDKTVNYSISNLC